MAIKRLQNYCLQFALGIMDRDDLNIHRRQVVGAFAAFKPGTLIEKEVSTHESFKPAWAAAQRFLDAARDLEEGRQKIEPVFEIGDEAAAAWGKLAERRDHPRVPATRRDGKGDRRLPSDRGALVPCHLDPRRTLRPGDRGRWVHGPCCMAS